MGTNVVSGSAAMCVVCGSPFPPKTKGGEISIRLSSKHGKSLVIAGAVCRECAAKSADPVVAMEQMRCARVGLLDRLVNEVGA